PGQTRIRRSDLPPYPLLQFRPLPTPQASSLRLSFHHPPAFGFVLLPEPIQKKERHQLGRSPVITEQPRHLIILLVRDHRPLQNFRVTLFGLLALVVLRCLLDQLAEAAFDNDGRTLAVREIRQFPLESL